MKKLLILPWLIWPLFTSAMNLQQGLAQMIKGKIHVYYGPEEEKASQELSTDLKEAANAKGFKAIRFNGHVIVHDSLGYTQAWMLHDCINNCINNEYLLAKLMGAQEDDVRTYYGHLKHNISDFRKDKKEAILWMGRWKKK